MNHVFNQMIALSYYPATFDFVHFVLGFVLLVCAVAVVVILVRWLFSLAGFTVPQPLMVAAGILLFMVLLIMLVNWSGLYRF